MFSALSYSNPNYGVAAGRKIAEELIVPWTKGSECVVEAKRIGKMAFPLIDLWQRKGASRYGINFVEFGFGIYSSSPFMPYRG